LKRGFISAVLVIVLLLACNTSAIPGECLEAMEDNNISKEIIELVKEKAGGDLNVVQRTAIRLAFEKAGVDDVCGEFAE
jgi:hypothetical protein